MTVNSAIVFAFAAVLFLTREGEADGGVKVDPEQVKAVVTLVVAELQGRGFKVKDMRHIPPVYVIDLAGADAITTGQVIVLNAKRPVGCFESFIAHEATHVILAEQYGWTARESEFDARRMDRLVASNNVNCSTKE